MIQQYTATQTVSREEAVLQKIRRSVWWRRASTCVDPHYSNTSGVMLVDHLTAVTDNVERIFTARHLSFLCRLFLVVEEMGLSKEKIREELKIAALLHDIGKTEDDKSITMPHPLDGHLTIKRHSVVGVFAAKEILQHCDLLSDEQKATIYSVIEEHDVPYGLFREYKQQRKRPTFERWQELNEKVSNQPGVGLVYLLLFKLADVHGHCNIEDVIWFFESASQTYFRALGLQLPIPRESDIR
jgi:hypothetical protein